MKQLSFDQELNFNQQWLFVAGLIFCAAGIILLLNFYIPEGLLNYFLFITYLIISIVTMIHSFKFWYRKLIGFTLHIFSSLLYLAVGCLFLLNIWIFIYPIIPIVLFVFIFAFATMGIFRLVISYSQSFKYGWLWTGYCGLINLLLIIFICVGINKIPFTVLTMSSGIDVLFTGIALIGLGFGVNSIKNKTSRGKASR